MPDGLDTASSSPESRPFQVDLRGVVDLLSRHIYSSPQVYLRELLQNGRDAVRARADHDPTAPAGLLRIEPVTNGGDFVFRDNGQGLSAAEAADLLATVGRSSKRDDVLNLRREEYLGQFGIGLLSCFMVSDRIVVRSRSASGAAPIEWTGSANGTFSVRELDPVEASGLEVGTEVRLRPRPDDAALLGTRRVTELARRFGEYLPVPVQVRQADGSWNTLTHEPLFLRSGEADEALLDEGQALLGARPFDAIDIVVPGSGTRGTAFVLPFAPPPGAKQASRAYLGRMLLGESVDALLPEWAFFVRLVVDTTGLRPTASREQFVADDALEYTREQIGEALRRWLILQATTRPHRLAEFIGIHHLALKALAVHDAELAALVVPWLSVQTSAGEMTIEQYLALTDTVRYTETIDEFRQISAVVDPEHPVINAGHIYEAELLRQLPHTREDIRVERVTVSGEIANLDPPALDDRERALALETRASAALADAEVTVQVRRFRPEDLPGLYVADPEVLRRLDRGRAAAIAPGLWGGVLDKVGDILGDPTGDTGAGGPRAQLCLNWDNPLVRQLAGLDDALVVDRSVRLLYVQSMLAGHRPLSRADRGLLTGALTDLVQLSVGLSSATTSEGNPA